MKRKIFIVLAVLVSSLGKTKGTHESSCVRFASPSNTLSSIGADVYFQKDDYLPDDGSPKIVKLNDAEAKGFTWQLFVLDVNEVNDNDWIDGWLFIKIYTGPVIPVKTVTVVAEDSYGRPIGEFVPFKEVPFHKNCNNAPFESVDLPGQYLPCRGIGAYDPIQPTIFHYSVEMNEKSDKGPPTFPWIHKLDHTVDRFEMYWRYSQTYCNMLSRFRFKAVLVSREVVNGAHKHVVREAYSKWVYIENLLGSDPLHYYDQYRNCRPTIVNDSLIVLTPYEWIVHYGNEDNPKFPPVSPIRCGRDGKNTHGSYTGRCSYKDDERYRKTDRKTEVFLEASYKNPPGCKPKDPNFKLTHDKFTDYMKYVIQFHNKPIPIGSGATVSESGCCYIIPDIPIPLKTITTTKKPTTTTRKSTTTKKPTTTTTKKPTTTTTKKSTTTTKKSATPTKEPTATTEKSIGVPTENSVQNPVVPLPTGDSSTDSTSTDSKKTTKPPKQRRIIFKRKKPRRVLSKWEMDEEIRIGLTTDFPYAHSIWDKRKFHGLLMSAITMFVIPFSYFMARYYKETFMNSRVNFSRVWYFIHGLSILLIIKCYIGGLYSIHQSKKYAGRSLSPQAVYHRFYGWISVAIFVLMGVFGGIRPYSITPRLICIGLHWTLGMVMYLMNLYLVINSVWIPGSPSADEDIVMVDQRIVQHSITEIVILAAVAWIFLEIIFHVIMSVHLYFMDQNARLTEKRKITPGTVAVFDELESNDLPGYFFRITMLGIHGFCSLVATIVICSNIAEVELEGRGYGPMFCTHTEDGKALREELHDYCKTAHEWWF